MKPWSVVKLVPLVRTENTVPTAAGPPAAVVPYSVLPDRTKAASGVAPSLLVAVDWNGLYQVALKVYTVVKPAPLVPTLNTVPLKVWRRHRSPSRTMWPRTKSGPHSDWPRRSRR